MCGLKGGFFSFVRDRALGNALLYASRNSFFVDSPHSPPCSSVTVLKLGTKYQAMKERRRKARLSVTTLRLMCPLLLSSAPLNDHLKSVLGALGVVAAPT